MHLGNPTVLWLLPFWLFLVFLGARALAWRRRVAHRIGQPELIGRLYPVEVRLWRRRRMTLILAGLLLLIVAAARPQYGRIERSIHSVGTNILIAMDCSKSMDADDVQPSRIEAAKRSLQLLLQQLTGNRVGLIAFAGEAVLICPMTLDHEIAMLDLQNLDTDAVSTPGTDLGDAIDKAADAFERGAPEGGRALILITDGEDLEGKAAAAARRAKEKKMRVFAIGIGTSRGTPLLAKAEPIQAYPGSRYGRGNGNGNGGSSGGFMEDPVSGGKVNTRMHMETLEEVAHITGGAAYAAEDSPSAAVDRVMRQMATLAKTDLESRKQVLFQDRYQWFLAPALLLILWALLLRPTPTRLGQEQSAAAPAARAAI